MGFSTVFGVDVVRGDVFALGDVVLATIAGLCTVVCERLAGGGDERVELFGGIPVLAVR